VAFTKLSLSPNFNATGGALYLGSLRAQRQCRLDHNDAMENSASDGTWDDIFNGTTSAIDVQMAQSDFDLWDQMIFSDTGTLNGATGPHSLATPNIDSIVATPQSVQNLAANNQKLSPNPDNEPFPTSQPAPQIDTLPLEDLSVIQDIKKEAKELLDA